jgi:hypothetical protein
VSDDGRLGKQIREYGTRSFGQWFSDEAKDLGLLYVVVGLFWTFTRDHAVYGPVASVFFGLLGVMTLYHLIKWIVRAEKVQVFENGLRHVVRGKKREVSWSQIEGIHTSFVDRHHRTGVTKEYLFRLEATGDRTFEFTQEYPAVIELAQLVAKKLSER